MWTNKVQYLTLMAQTRSSWVPISSVPASFSELPNAESKAKMTGSGN